MTGNLISEAAKSGSTPGTVNFTYIWFGSPSESPPLGGGAKILIGRKAVDRLKRSYLDCLFICAGNDEIKPIDPQENIIDQQAKYGSEMSQADMRTMANESAFLNRLETKKMRLSYVTEDTVTNYKLEDVHMVVPGHGVAYPKVFSGIFIYNNLYTPSFGTPRKLNGNINTYDKLSHCRTLS